MVAFGVQGLVYVYGYIIFPSEIKDLTKDIHSSLLPWMTVGWIMTGRAVTNYRQCILNNLSIGL